MQDLFTQYIFSDIEYLKWLFLAVLIDLITGLTGAYVNKIEITSKGLRDTVGKTVQYCSFIIVTHLLSSFTVGGEGFLDLKEISTLSYKFLILVEVKSVYENILKINPKLDFINSILSKLKTLIK